MPAQQTIRSEAGDLLARVTLHMVRECHFQTSPCLALHFGRCDLLSLESRMGVEEWSVEVRPQSLATEIGDIDIIPRRVALLTCEGCLGVVARRDRRPVRLLHYH